MRHINTSSKQMPLMKELRVDYKEIQGSNFTFLVCQYTNKVYYSKRGIIKLRDMYCDFSYLTECMFRIDMYIPIGMIDQVSMIQGVEYYF